MVEGATVTPPEMIGLFVWWAVIMAAPLTVVRRWRRRPGGLRRTSERVRELVTSARLHGGAVARDRESAATGLESGKASPPQMAREAADDRLSLSARAASPPGAATSPAPASRGTRSVAQRLPSDALAPLCRYVDFQRRLELAVSELRAKLARLPASRWRIEPYPLTGERRNTLLVLGDTGVFVISATYAPGHWDDVVTVSTLARKIQALLPGYCGQVQAAICHPFSASAPRVWHRADDHGEWIGAWLIGGDSMIAWLEQFGAQDGLTPGDLARFDALSSPNWLKPAIAVARTWPPLPQRADSNPPA